MWLEPAVVPGLEGIEIVEHDVDGGVRPSGDDVVHEVEELDAPPAFLRHTGIPKRQRYDEHPILS